MSKKSPRHLLRQTAVQILYAWDLGQFDTSDISARIAEHTESFEFPADDSKEFCKSLVEGVIQNKKALDKVLAERLENYDLSRVNKIDLTILRLGCYELLFRADIPPVTSINEAVELAKDFASEESGKFINGILDKIAAKLDRPLRKAIE
jgi:transcription antitermination protein NusB